MSKYQKALNKLRELKELKDKISRLQTQEEWNIINYLEYALDMACSELEEYTQLKCEYHCGGGCYNIDKDKCDDDCFFKKRQNKDDWKEQLLEESEEQ